MRFKPQNPTAAGSAAAASLVKTTEPPRIKRPLESPLEDEQKQVKRETVLTNPGARDQPTLQHLRLLLTRHAGSVGCGGNSCIVCKTAHRTRFPTAPSTRCVMDRKCLRCMSPDHRIADCTNRLVVRRESGCCFICLLPTSDEQHTTEDGKVCEPGKACKSYAKGMFIPLCFLSFRSRLRNRADFPARHLPSANEPAFCLWLCEHQPGSRLLNALRLALWVLGQSE